MNSYVGGEGAGGWSLPLVSKKKLLLPLVELLLVNVSGGESSSFSVS
jgi:hypothetical protein